MKKALWMTVLLAIIGTAAFAGSGLLAGLDSFQPVDAEEEGYWYSRYNLGNLVMRSGMGLTFKPPMEAVKSMMQAVDANPNDGDSPMVKKGIALLKAVYKSGDPHYIKPLDVNDFSTQRWDPATFEKVVNASASGWTIIKEAEWAKQFHVDGHFGSPSSNFGAQWRFVGMVMNASAKTQAAYLLQHLRGENGLITDSNGQLDWTGQWILLEAFSNLAGYLDQPTLPHSSSNRYRDPRAAKLFGSAAARLFAALNHRQPQNVRELSQAVQALTWYAAADQKNRDAALGRARALALQLSLSEAKGAGQRGYKLRGLIEAWRLSQDPFFKREAAYAFNELVAPYNFEHGMFKGETSHSIDDVAAILGATNAAKLFLGEAIDQNLAEKLFSNFFESAFNLGQLQQSVPPIPVGKGTFEQAEPPLYYGYPSLPKPPMAGGQYGIAPVFASAISWNAAANRFRVSNHRFDTAGAMHAANELIWFHNNEVNGFPQIH